MTTLVHADGGLFMLAAILTAVIVVGVMIWRLIKPTGE